MLSEPKGELPISVTLPKGYALELEGAEIWKHLPVPVHKTEIFVFCYGKTSGKEDLSCPKNFCGFIVDRKTDTLGRIEMEEQTKYFNTSHFEVMVKPSEITTTEPHQTLTTQCSWDLSSERKLPISAALPNGYALELEGAEIWKDLPIPVHETEIFLFCYGKTSGTEESLCPKNFCGFSIDRKSDTKWSIEMEERTKKFNTSHFDVMIKPSGITMTAPQETLKMQCSWDLSSGGKLPISVILPQGYALELEGAEIWKDPPVPVHKTEVWVWILAGIGGLIVIAIIIGAIYGLFKYNKKKKEAQKI
uniref:Uncharacterized protein n=1 Tax=Panagrolaimus sp. JU765 TaxID=591449 RepID=A0AC34Q3V3_9BILA